MQKARLHPAKSVATVVEMPTDVMLVEILIGVT
jgi:hypothetical protein